MTSADQELTIIARFRDLMSRGLTRAQRAVLRFTQVASAGFKRTTAVLGKLRSMVFGLPGLLAAVATGGIAAISRGMIQAASDAEETASRFAVSMGLMEDEANAVAETLSGDMGRAIGQIQGSMADFQSLLVSQGFGEAEALDASEALTQLGIDLASFQNVSDERASNALRSALLGEAEALKQLNIFVREGQLAQEAMNLGLIESKRELSDQEKVLARLSIILRSNTLAHGDAARTMDSFANSSKRLESQVQGLRVEMGQRLIVAIQEAMQEMGGEAVVLEVVRTGFEIVVGVAKEFIKASVTLVQTISHVNSAMEENGGQAQVMGRIFGLLGSIIQATFSTAAVVVLGFEQGIDTVVWAARSLWNILQLLAGALAYVVLELVAFGATAWIKFGEGITWVVNVIRDGLLSVLDVLADKLVGTLQNLQATFLFLARHSPVLTEDFQDMADSIGETISQVRGFNAAMQATPEFSGMDDFMARMEQTRAELHRLQDATVTFMTAQLGDISDATEVFVDDIMRDAEATQMALHGLVSAMEDVSIQGGQVAQDLEAVLAALDEIDATGTITTATATDLAASLERLDVDLESLAATMGSDVPSATQQAKTQLQTFFEFAGDGRAQLDQFAAGSLQNFASGLSGAFADFATGAASAKEAFGQFATQFLTQIVQMIAQMLILRAISGAFGGFFFADGGVIPGGTGEFQAFANGGVAKGGGLMDAIPMKAYANGGPVFQGPHMAIIGEGRFNEAVVPLPDGRRIPVEMRDGGRGGGTVNFNINMVDATGVDQLLTERRGTIEDVIANGMSSRRSFRTTMQGSFN